MYHRWMFLFTPMFQLLRNAIATKASRIRALTVVLNAVYVFVQRRENRLTALFARWRAGTLVVAMPGASRADEVRAKTARPRFRFPSQKAWLRAATDHEVGAFAGQIQHLATHDAEFRQFLAEVPQAGRLLRPILAMLTTDRLPAVLAIVRKPFVAPKVGLMTPDGVVGAVAIQKFPAEV